MCSVIRFLLNRKKTSLFHNENFTARICVNTYFMWVALHARICLLWRKDWFYDERRLYNRTFYKQSSVCGCLYRPWANCWADLSDWFMSVLTWSRLKQKLSWTAFIHLSPSDCWYFRYYPAQMTDTPKSSCFFFSFSDSFNADKKKIILWWNKKKKEAGVEWKMKRSRPGRGVVVVVEGSEMMALADCIQFKSSPSAILIFISQPGIGSVWVVSRGLSGINLRPWSGPAPQTTCPLNIPVFRRNEGRLPERSSF